MSIREYGLDVAISTPDQPSAGTPTADEDLLTKEYADDTYAPKASPILSGTVLLQNAAGAQPELHFSEDPDNGTNVVKLKAPATLGGDVTLTLPDNDGDSGQFLTTNGSGVTSWTTPSPSSLTIDTATGTSGFTWTSALEDIQCPNPSAAITIKLDNSFSATDTLYLFNEGTAAISVTANDNSLIATVYPGTSNVFITKTSTPATNTTWKAMYMVTSNEIFDAAIMTPTNFGVVSNRNNWWYRKGSRFFGEGFFTTGTIPSAIQDLALPFAMHNTQYTMTQKHVLGFWWGLRLTSGNIYNDNGGVIFASGSDFSNVFFALSSGGTAQQWTKTNAVGFFPGSGSGIFYKIDYAVNAWTDYTG